MTASHDSLSVFLLPDAGVRGAHVQLGTTWQTILARSDPPAALHALLGQAVAATALLTAHVKIEGRLSLQLRAPGMLRNLFAECTARGTLRALVRTRDDSRDDAALAPCAADLRQLGEGAMLAITIENPRPHGEPMRYQGIVPLESATLAEAFGDYFRQSEQLPTLLLLAADANNARGLLLQKLPGEDGDSDGWPRIAHLFATLGHDELLHTDAATVLHRLFHQENLEWLGERALDFGCSCSDARVSEVLRTLGEEEALAAVAAGPDNRAEVRCEFCGQRYHFDTAAIRTLFATPTATSQASERLH